MWHDWVDTNWHAWHHVIGCGTTELTPTDMFDTMSLDVAGLSWHQLTSLTPCHWMWQDWVDTNWHIWHHVTGCGRIELTLTDMLTPCHWFEMDVAGLSSPDVRLQCRHFWGDCNLVYIIATHMAMHTHMHTPPTRELWSCDGTRNCRPHMCAVTWPPVASLPHSCCG